MHTVKKIHQKRKQQPTNPVSCAASCKYWRERIGHHIHTVYRKVRAWALVQLLIQIRVASLCPITKLVNHFSSSAHRWPREMAMHTARTHSTTVQGIFRWSWDLGRPQTARGPHEGIMLILKGLSKQTQSRIHKALHTSKLDLGRHKNDHVARTSNHAVYICIRALSGQNKIVFSCKEYLPLGEPQVRRRR